MKPAALLGLTAACAVCCVLPGAFSLVTALSLGSLLDWRFGLAAAAVALVVIVLVMAHRRAAPAPTCATAADACGCANANAVKRVARVG